MSTMSTKSWKDTVLKDIIEVESQPYSERISSDELRSYLFSTSYGSASSCCSTVNSDLPDCNADSIADFLRTHFRTKKTGVDIMDLVDLEHVQTIDTLVDDFIRRVILPNVHVGDVSDTTTSTGLDATADQVMISDDYLLDHVVGFTQKFY